ncbi:uncharacterized protein LOC105849873 [Hydra vulgaris]|uniref:Uncharacterized protein LOC105849873 n=1 Tax=Hydra vulgaris TaxID=6087 RepID=A0ABM4CXG7_HYDVU
MSVTRNTFKDSIRKISIRSSVRLKETLDEISFRTRSSKKKEQQKYRIVDPRAGQIDGISFEVIGKQGTYLRVKDNLLIPDNDTADPYFNKDTTFVPLRNMWFKNFFSFESASKPSHFIRAVENEIMIDKYDGTTNFKEEASFLLNRKPCATCLQVGVHAWAKLQTGEYCLGKVNSMDEEKIYITFANGKSEVYYKSEASGLLIPDLVPNASEIKIGTRVIAQWMHRNTLYPGVVSGMRRGDSYDVLFDDGDTGRGKSIQIRIMRGYCFSVSNCKKTCHKTSSCEENIYQTSSNDSTESCDRVVEEKNTNSLWCAESILASSVSADSFVHSNATHLSLSPLSIKGQSSKCLDNSYRTWTETSIVDSGYHEFVIGDKNIFYI